jgi:MIP family channel proteins
MSFGLVVMAMIFAVGHISGCHINPAVTIAFRTVGRINNRRAAGFILAQLGGALLGAFAIVAIIGDAGQAGASAPRVAGAAAALWSELILTFFLVFVVLAVATDERAEGAFAAIAVGGYVGFAAIGWGLVANASMNPARSFGPAIAGGVWNSHWVYWLGPIAGGVVAALVYELLRSPTSMGAAGVEEGSPG